MLSAHSTENKKLFYLNRKFYAIGAALTFIIVSIILFSVYLSYFGPHASIKAKRVTKLFALLFEAVNQGSPRAVAHVYMASGAFIVGYLAWWGLVFLRTIDVEGKIPRIGRFIFSMVVHFLMIRASYTLFLSYTALVFFVNALSPGVFSNGVMPLTLEEKKAKFTAFMNQVKARINGGGMQSAESAEINSASHIEKLFELKNKGAITEEEFQKMKSKHI